MRETDLYPPIKAFLEARGYVVKGDVADCDVVGLRGDEPPVVVELKRALSLELVLQAVKRQRSADLVYVAFAARAEGRAVGAWRARRREVLRLCRMLGLGLLTVDLRDGGSTAAQVEAHLDPGPYAPRRDARRQKRLTAEFLGRVGDPMAGGGPGRAMLTAYRQDALRCARYLAAAGEARPAAVRDAAKTPRAGEILRSDVYGWFERVERGVYRLSPQGRAALETWAGALDRL